MKKFIIAMATSALLVVPAFASEHGHSGSAEMDGKHVAVSDKVMDEQREALARNTEGKGFGPQTPRDIDSVAGDNKRIFGRAPASAEMNLCNIHFHESAEHKGKDFSLYAGNGNGEGYGSGYKYSGTLSQAELAPVAHNACPSAHGDLEPGDTIEVHYVYSTAQVMPGPTLGSCLSDSINNPQLRVETQVYVLVNDKNALDFGKLAQYSKVGGLYQATAIPNNTGNPVEFEGSTTGPGYNEKGSPFQVTWSVRPQVAKVNTDTVGNWCKGNDFKEDHAHGVRNLVKDISFLSTIK